MAAAFLASHSIDLQHEISRVQFPDSSPTESSTTPQTVPPVTLITGPLLASSPSNLYDIHLSPSTKRITSTFPHWSRKLQPSTPSGITIQATGCLALPSLCHPHIHLDKAHLYSSPLYSTLRPRSGSFHEALALTAAAKELYTEDDLLQRGDWLISESVAAGVTHMRAFVEVDSVVQRKCLEAGIELKRRWESKCNIQLCVFAQEAVFTNPSWDGSTAEKEQANNNKHIIEAAIETYSSIEAIGSTPYVESIPEKARQNIDWIVNLAIKKGKHLDLHLDYTLDPAIEPLIWHVVSTLHRCNWIEKALPGKTICLGHCTRLTLFTHKEWTRLKNEIGDIPISFIALPTSDLFMMGCPSNGGGREEENWQDRPRGTLQVPWLIKELGLNAAIGVNNVGNAFTPQGSADPLAVAGLGVGLYQAGTVEDAELLYVS